MFGSSRLEPDQLRRSAFFQKISDSAFATLMASGLSQRLPPGVILSQEGYLPSFMYLLTEGMIELFSNHDGRETTLTFITPVRSYSLGAIISNETYLESSRTLSSSQTIAFPAKTIRTLIETEASFAQAISGELADSNRRYVRELKNQKLRTALERLAAWILKTDMLHGSSGKFRLGFGKRTLASLLGMTPENLSRTFAILKESGIHMSGREISITRRGELEQIAKLSQVID